VAYWLMKSEPDAFSIDDLARRGREHWDGVRSFQARNNMRAMKVGDRAFFYHSSTHPPGVAGISEIVREAYPDHTAWDPSSKYFDPSSNPEKPRWYMVDVAFVEKFPRLVTLEELKRTPGLEDMPVTQRGMRLSVQPVSETHWQIVVDMAGLPG
jgi:predicted RNA-binding protein with PUA-like domain